MSKPKPKVVPKADASKAAELKAARKKHLDEVAAHATLLESEAKAAAEKVAAHAADVKAHAERVAAHEVEVKAHAARVAEHAKAVKDAAAVVKHWWD